MNDPFGAPTGKLTDLSGAELKNEFASIPTRSVDDMVQSDRIQPRQVGTGVMRGTQRIVNTDGSYITLGEVPDDSGDFGIAFFNADDELVSKDTGATEYVYDLNTGKNIVQFKKLPDGTFGLAIAKSGYDISEAITEDDS